MKDILTFLTLLKENNNREWFNDNKYLYENAKGKFEGFVNILIPKIKEFDNEIDVTSAKECTYRIYRDVRFSKNKEPYKPNMGAYISKGGKKSKYAGYYFHIETNASFAGGGIYRPQPKILKAVRNNIFEDASKIKDLISKKEFKETFPEMYGEKLKTAPRGFPKDFQDIDLLNYKSYVVVKNLTNQEILSKTVLDDLIKVFKTQKPFNDYLNSIIK